MTTASLATKTADIVQYAIDRVQDERNANTDGSLGYICIWTDNQKGLATTSKGRDYLREGVGIVVSDNNSVTITKVIDNAMTAGEVVLSGCAARNVELIQGAIETMLGDF